MTPTHEQDSVMGPQYGQNGGGGRKRMEKGKRLRMNGRT